ncbi:MAG: AAA family ATPase [Lachnospiraceae bacterium]|nr:AAA family ATPase [Lachnospiraceae bacterium]
MADEQHSVIFDFGSAKKADGADKDAAVTYEVFHGTNEEADADHPLLVLENPKGAMVHHVNGDFLNPHRRTGFECDTPESVHTKKVVDILRIDDRFIRLLEFLGGERKKVRLSGKAFSDGFHVYRIRLIDPSARTNIVTSENAFLQLAIERILMSRMTEEDEDEEENADEKEEKLSGISEYETYLSIAGFTLPKSIRTWAVRNLALTKSNSISPEERRHAQRALNIMLNIRWRDSYFESINPYEARRILDEELYGMEGVKQRIIETVIQINRTHTLPFYGLLLVGPAGIGKSQVAYAVARILKLPWISLDMSTIHDPETLTGSPRVYANAKPGRIMEGFYEARTSNLVFIINELDKADTGSASGNPADALLTLLDNLGFTDNYVECSIPTTGVYPIATANDKSRISAPLMSRFAVIEIPDYSDDEKKVILQKFSLPKILRRMGMNPEECVLTDEALDVVLRKCSNSTGVRDLEQAAEHLAANALYRIETEHVSGVTFDGPMTAEILEV